MEGRGEERKQAEGREERGGGKGGGGKWEGGRREGRRGERRRERLRYSSRHTQHDFLAPVSQILMTETNNSHTHTHTTTHKLNDRALKGSSVMTQEEWRVVVGREERGTRKRESWTWG